MPHAFCSSLPPSGGPDGPHLRLAVYDPEDAKRQGERPLCRHCRGRLAMAKRRGLCRRCWDDGPTRGLYPADPRGGHGDGLDFSGPAPLPATPTAALPSTAAKLAVLAERAARGEALFHPDDARGDKIGDRHGLLAALGLAVPLASVVPALAKTPERPGGRTARVSAEGRRFVEGGPDGLPPLGAFGEVEVTDPPPRSPGRPGCRQQWLWLDDAVRAALARAEAAWVRRVKRRANR